MATALRVLDIFEAFAALQKPLTLSQLAEAVDAPVSSCFGVVKALEERGYLHSVSSRKEWYPTGRMLQNTRAIERSEPLIARFDPILAALRDQTNETVILGQAASSGLKVIYLNVFESAQAIRYSTAVGVSKPLYSTAVGKVLLGCMPPDQRSRLVSRLRTEAVTDRTLTDTTSILADIEKGLKRGYQITRGENVVDVGAIAMPVQLLGRTFGVAVAGPLQRLDPKVKAHAAALASACRQLDALAG
ncbi:MAG: helix-turn-helix domain-containing protein [Beijerinckiaceae bacterium]|jgi:IclR family acetate operon transcriptional repressor|nr:helix-turn-helix domain-containing protein [Beijerinckiaceae bacterium]